MLAKSIATWSMIAAIKQSRTAVQASPQVSSAAQRNDLIESRASHLFIQYNSGCERDGAAKLAH